MLTSLKNPILFGHRGACAHAPENTLESFNLAIEHKADAIEFDVKLSKDGEVVVIHDQTVDRTTDGKGKVNELTLAELKALDAGSKFDSKFVNVKIPTLDEVFEDVGNKIYINVELTNYNSPKDDLLEKVAKIVKAHKLEKRIIFSSFLPGNIELIQKLMPDVPAGLLCFVGIGGILSRSSFYRKLSPIAVHPYLGDTTRRYVEREHSKGRRVHVWTVNKDADIKRMIDFKVDGIFTDDPLKARKILES